MRKLFATLTVLSLVLLGTAAFVAPAQAATNLFAPSDNGGSANS